jgi:hypothetical protein
LLLCSLATLKVELFLAGLLSLLVYPGSRSEYVFGHQASPMTMPTVRTTASLDAIVFAIGTQARFQAYANGCCRRSPARSRSKRG